MDNEVRKFIGFELDRQNNGIELIASENYASKEVREMMSSILTNKYAEGYPGKRYYGGCEFIDEIENIAINRACQLFGSKFANVLNLCLVLVVLNLTVCSQNIVFQSYF